MKFANKNDDFLYVFIHVGKCAGYTIRRGIESRFSPSERLLATIGITPQKIKKYLETPQKNKDALSGLTEQQLRTLKARWNLVTGYTQRKWVDELVFARSEEVRRAVKIIYGHHPYFGIHEHFHKEPRYVTFLRHPVSRIISHYNYILSSRPTRQKPLKIVNEDGSIVPFEEWLDICPIPAMTSNYMVWFLSQRYAGEHINNPDFVPNEKHLSDCKEMLNRFYFVGLTESRNRDIDFFFNRIGVRRFINKQNASSPHFRLNGNTALEKNILAKNQLDMELYHHALELNKKFIRQHTGYDRAVFAQKCRTFPSRFLPI